MINDNVCGNCKTYEKQVWAANWTPEQRLKMHNCQLVNCEENVTLSISFPFCYLFTSLVPLPTEAKQHAEGRNDEPVREKLKITKHFCNLSTYQTCPPKTVRERLVQPPDCIRYLAQEVNHKRDKQRPTQTNTYK